MDGIDDKTLLQAEMPNRAGTFLAAAAAAVVALTLTWGASMEGFRSKWPFHYTTAESNIFYLAKELLKPDPQLAIVGSSLSRRLNPGLFANTRMMDLSMEGGSVLAGLEILNRAPSLPQVILIEINILDREVDEEWVAKGGYAARGLPWMVLSGISKPLRTLLSSPAFSRVSLEHWSDDWLSRRARLMASPPGEYDIDAQVAAGQKAWSQRNSWHIADRSTARIKVLMSNLEARGAQVYLLYLPYASGYDSHPYARRNRELASGSESFDCRKCIDVRTLTPVSELRWVDGAHLDDRSALVVAAALERRLSFAP